MDKSSKIDPDWVKQFGDGSKFDPLFSSAKTGGSDSWATPEWLFRKIEEVISRKFELDPCADAINTKCKNFYDEEKNGLIQPWAEFGSIFINPPYSQIKLWAKKTYEESKELKAAEDVAVLLIPARTDTSYWHDHITKASDIYFLRGRVKFGDSKNSAPFPSAVAVFRAPSPKPRPVLSHYVCWKPQ